jgi:hypothetical protein
MENEDYSTRDLAESAALLISKQKLISYNWVGKICWFYFEDKEKCRELSNEYFFGELLVNAREFDFIRRKLINRINAAKKVF